MPELPEVRTVVATLNEMNLKQKITGVKIYWNNIIATDVKDFQEKLVNQKINDIKSYGKLIVFILDDFVIASHLRMEGKYFVKEVDEEKTKHDHVEIYLESKKIVYNDTRKFGKMYLIDKENYLNNPPFLTIGKEPWDVDQDFLIDKFKKIKLPIKTTLLNQLYMSGLGNIYVDEVLFRCRIHPEKKTSELSKKEIENIIINSKKVLEFAISLGGTTIKSYTSSLGVTGRFQNELQVHTRVNESCVVCKTTIIKLKVGGRGTYICPKCQKM